MANEVKVYALGGTGINLVKNITFSGNAPAGVASNLSMETPLSFINTLGYIPEVLKQYEDLLANFKSLDVTMYLSY